MSKELNMNLHLKKLDGTREDLLKALIEISDTDCDFNSENGIGYLWDKAKGYNSNQEYLIDKVKDFKTDREVIKTFFKEWLENDSYYEDYCLEVIYDNNQKAEVLAISILC